MPRSHRWTMLALLALPTMMLAMTLQAQSGARGQDGADGDARTPRSSFLAEGLTTLYAHDPIARALSFSDGRYGAMIQDHEVRNRNSDIDFGGYVAGAFSVGIEGGREGAIVDLGHADTLGERYGFRETVGGGQGYASIRFVEGDLHIRSNGRATQPLKEAAGLTQCRRNASAATRMGHVYLVRLIDRHDESFELVAKFMVVEHRDGESATLRWQQLR
ncbi:MAG: hypothetical protein HKO59_03930 [Phycisphaerales bacterium]|nr:hypothetical protein [Phycisphaerales bacterium]